MAKGLLRSLLDALAKLFGRRPISQPVTTPRTSDLPLAAASTSHLEDESELTTWFDTHASCPDCGGTEFIDGPRGGMSMNIQCARPSCGSWYNTARIGGHFLFVQRIHPEGSPRRTLH